MSQICPLRASRPSVLILALSILVSSCAELKLNPPSEGADTLLLLPIKSENTSSISYYGFYSVYELTRSNNDTYTIDMKPQNKQGFVAVNYLPTGNYSISKLKMKPVGSGYRGFGTEERRDDKFTLEKGKITILPISLNITQYNRDYKQATAAYNHKMVPASQMQTEEILKTLKAQENFGKWEVLEE